MSESKELTRGALLAVARFAEIFERPDFDAGRVVGDAGKEWFKSSPVVDDFVREIQARGILVKFDWLAWRDEADRIESSEAAVAGADLETILKLITRRVREERFSEGSLARWIKSGQAARVLMGLEALARAMEAEG